MLPNIQIEPPLAEHEAILSSPISSYVGEEADPHQLLLEQPPSLSLSLFAIERI